MQLVAVKRCITKPASIKLVDIAGIPMNKEVEMKSGRVMFCEERLNSLNATHFLASAQSLCNNTK